MSSRALFVIAPLVWLSPANLGHKQFQPSRSCSPLVVLTLRVYSDGLPSLCYHTSWIIFRREILFQAPGENRATQPLHERPPLLFLRDGSAFSQMPPWLGSEVAAPCGFSQTIVPLPPMTLLPAYPSEAPKVSSHGCCPEIVPSWLSLHLSPRKGSI